MLSDCTDEGTEAAAAGAAVWLILPGLVHSAGWGDGYLDCPQIRQTAVAARIVKENIGSETK